jgi:streptogramin lyase
MQVERYFCLICTKICKTLTHRALRSKMNTPFLSGSLSSCFTSSFNSDSKIGSYPSFSREKLRRSFLAASGVASLLLVSAVAQGQATDFGSEAVGSTSSATAVTVTLATSATLGSISVVTQGTSGLDYTNAGSGTCATGTGYSSGDSCTVNVTFKPLFAGSRFGAVVLQDGSGNVIGTSYLQGNGSGPQTIFSPGTQSETPTSGIKDPSGVAVDANGNVYIADSSHNRVLKETLSAGIYTESTVPTSALDFPYGLVVDGAGNVYIADPLHQRILKETPSAGSYTESTIPTSTLNYPYVPGVDGAGNVYIADSLNNRVLKETLSAGTYTESTVPTGTLNCPSIAVDGGGNIYIVNYDSPVTSLLKETWSGSSYTESTITTSSMAWPFGIGVDGNGNVYVGDTENNRIVKETPVSGSYTESVVPTSGLLYPAAVAVDGSGNVYVADQGNNRIVKEDLADAPTVSFAATPEGSTSSDSPRTVTVNNYGNSSLTISGVSFPTDFPENGSATGDCTSSTILAPTTSCTLTINFTPVTFLNGSASADLTEGVAVTTNTLNVPATQQTVTVTGTETQP